MLAWAAPSHVAVGGERSDGGVRCRPVPSHNAGVAERLPIFSPVPVREAGSGLDGQLSRLPSALRARLSVRRDRHVGQVGIPRCDGGRSESDFRQPPGRGVLDENVCPLDETPERGRLRCVGRIQPDCALVGVVERESRVEVIRGMGQCVVRVPFNVDDLSTGVRRGASRSTDRRSSARGRRHAALRAGRTWASLRAGLGRAF